MGVQRFKRGQIWWMKDNSLDYKEHLIGGTRPVIIVSNDAANKFSSNITIVPCTTADKKDIPTHVKLEINGPSTALCEMITTISNVNISSYIGTCDDKLMSEINHALVIAIGLDSKDRLILENIEEQMIETKDIIIENTTTKVEANSRGRKPKYTLEDKIRFINDYENHDKEYMMKKYKLKTAHALNDKVYMFRKYIRENS